MKQKLVAALLLLVTADQLGAQAGRMSAAGGFVSGQIVTATSFDISYVPGDYPAPGLVRHISEEEARIGASKFSGGLRVNGGWGFSRYLAAFAGFDFMGGTFKFAGGESEGTLQMGIFTGLRISAPLSAPVTPYLFGAVGGLSVSTSNEPEIVCQVGGGCTGYGSSWGGGYFGFGGGLEIVVSKGGRGHLAFDVNVESLTASLGHDEGANEQYVKSKPKRIAVGLIWRWSRHQ